METPKSTTPRTATAYPSANGGSTTKPTPPSAGAGSARRSETLEVNKLRSELRSKLTEINNFAKEIKTLQNIISSKDSAIDDADNKRTLAEERAMQLQDEAAALKSAATTWQQERKRLTAELKAANDEADRLNNIKNSSAENTQQNSSENIVRLHNQLAEARKEIKRLKDDNKGAYNMIQAKDRALDEVQAQLQQAKDAAGTRFDDQNKILDLRRQLAQTRGQLGGTERMSQIAEMESDELRDALLAKESELEEQAEYVGVLQGEVAEAQAAQAVAERSAAEAKADTIAAKALVDRVKAVETERMQGGGFVAKSVHVEEIGSLQKQVEMLQEQLRLGAGNSGSSGQGGVSPVDMIALKAMSESANARALREHVEAAKLKVKLAEILGDMEYSLQFHQPPPTAEDIAALETQSIDAEHQADAATSALIAARAAAVQEKEDLQNLVTRMEEEKKAFEESSTRALAAEKAARDDADETLSKLAMLELSLVAGKRERETLEQKIDAFQKDADARVVSLEKQLEILRNDMISSKKETEEVQSRYDASERKNEAAQERLSVLEAELVEAQSALVESEKNSEQNAKKTNDEFGQLQSTLDETITKAAQDMQSLQNQLDAKEERCVELEKHLEENKISLQLIQSQLKDKTNENGAETRKLEALLLSKEEAAEVSSLRIASLQEHLAILESKYSGTQEELRSMKEELCNNQRDLEAAKEQADDLIAEIETRSVAAAIAAAATTAAVARSQLLLPPVDAPVSDIYNDDDAEQLQHTINSSFATPTRTFSALMPHPDDDDFDATAPGAATMAGGALSSADQHLQDLVASRIQIAELKEENDELKSQVTALTPLRDITPQQGGAHNATDEYDVGDIDNELSDSSDGVDALTLPARRFAPGSALHDGDVAMTPDALKGILDSLIKSRKETGGGDDNNNNNDDDDTLYNQAIALLRGELARLAKEMVDQTKEASRLRSEVGALHTASLSAEQTANLLNENNHLTMKTVSLQSEISVLQNEYARCEESLLREIASLKAQVRQAKQNSTLKKVGKAVSSTAKGGSRVISSAMRGLDKSLNTVVQNMNARSDMAAAAKAGAATENAAGDGSKTTSPLFAGLSKRFGTPGGSTREATPSRTQ